MESTKNIDREASSKIFVLTNCVEGKIEITIDLLRQINAITEISRTDGSYDLIVTLEAKSNDDLKLALAQLRKIETIKRTLALRSSDDLGVLG